jgi:NadR type nicotinamide-nucleotide adenylyltransferase
VPINNTLAKVKHLRSPILFHKNRNRIGHVSKRKSRRILPSFVMKKETDLSTHTNAIKVAVIGPESTGKTVLVKELAQFYNCNFVLEYARHYVESLKRRYRYDDIMVISKKQRELEKAAYEKSTKLLICDSAMITNKVWSYDKFEKCDPWIEKEIKLESFDLFLLCKPDLQWENDPVREDAERGAQIFEIYVRYLTEYNFDFGIVEGKNTARIDAAIGYIDKLFSTF